MYYEHFGLQYPPFKITPDTQLFYPGGNRGLVLDALVYAIENGEGIIKVVGEVGSGKTMLCRMLEEKLPKRIAIVYLANPHLTPDTILHAIALEMRLTIPAHCNHFQIMQILHTELLERHANSQQVIVFVEESQAMPLDTLEEIRLLSNLETSRHKLLQMVLFGQPELDVHLAVAHIRQLKERITHSFYLAGFSRKDIQDYLHFRMQAVGYRGPPIFSKSAVRTLSTLSKGLIRRINILADKALLAAFADNVHYVQAKHVQLAARDSGFSEIKSINWYFIGFSLLGISSIMVLILWLVTYQSEIMNWFAKEPKELVEATPLITYVPDKNITDPILRERLQATQRWLKAAPGEHYSIQVMLTAEAKTDDLVRFLRKSEMQPLLEHLYVYRAEMKGQIIWGIVYNEFKDLDSASAALATLPDMLRRNKPFLRTIASLRDKVAKNS